VLTDNGIAISMDGKGAWRDNVFVERLWRGVKYEEVLSASLRERQRGACLDRSLPQLLQSRITTPICLC
jgi:transposase InsO family protein